MFRRIAVGAFLPIVAVVVTSSCATLQRVSLPAGLEDDNSLKAKVLDASGVSALSITTFSETFDRNLDICRGVHRAFVGGPSFKLGKDVNFGMLFAEALKSEAPKMGFTLGSGGWTIGGALKEIYAETSQKTGYGALRFWGFLVVELDLTPPGAPAQKLRFRLHNYYQVGTFMNFSSKLPEETALARLMVDGAQELLGRLNRRFFRAPPDPSIAEMIAQMERLGSKAPESLIHAIGVSGSPEAVPVIQKRLSAEKDENARALLINALGRIGTPDLVPVLTAGYAADMEDGRWYILKAMDYIGTPEALAVIKEKGLRDEQAFNRDLAKRIVDNEAQR